jgi:hypothetical protein
VVARPDQGLLSNRRSRHASKREPLTVLESLRGRINVHEDNGRRRPSPRCDMSDVRRRAMPRKQSKPQATPK